jgi:hypothetical protein
MKIKEIKELIDLCKDYSLEELNEHLLYWQRSINSWVDKYRLEQEYKLSKRVLKNCLSWATNSAIIAEIISREILTRVEGTIEPMEPLNKSASCGFEEFADIFKDLVFEVYPEIEPYCDRISIFER